MSIRPALTPGLETKRACTRHRLARLRYSITSMTGPWIQVRDASTPPRQRKRLLSVPLLRSICQENKALAAVRWHPGLTKSKRAAAVSLIVSERRIKVRALVVTVKLSTLVPVAASD